MRTLKTVVGHNCLCTKLYNVLKTYIHYFPLLQRGVNSIEHAKCLGTQRIQAPFFIKFVPDLQLVHTKDGNLLEKVLYQFHDW